MGQKRKKPTATEVVKEIKRQTDFTYYRELSLSTVGPVTLKPRERSNATTGR